MKTRAWAFTINNYNADEERILHELQCQYIVVGREVGELGTPHLQGYVYFSTQRYLNGVKNILRRAHWEEARADANTNFNYCSKGGDFWTRGDMPMTQAAKGKVEQERWKTAWIEAKNGNLDAIDYDIRFRHYSTIKQVAKDYMAKPADNDKMDNYYYWGPPGVGKSRSARILYPEAYFKNVNKWWDGYQHEENVIIDEIDLDCKKTHRALKIWGQEASFIAEIKGGAMHIRPKRIILTSNYSMAEVFGYDLSLLAAMQRRYQEIYIGEPIDFVALEAGRATLPDAMEPQAPAAMTFATVQAAHVPIAAGVDWDPAAAVWDVDEEAMSVDFDMSVFDDLEAYEV